MPAKPEGPAQEPQLADWQKRSPLHDHNTCIHCRQKIRYQFARPELGIASGYWFSTATGSGCPKSEAHAPVQPLSPATPAPSQPAGARELKQAVAWIQEDLNRRSPIGPVGIMRLHRSDKSLAAVLIAFAREQTAAKDAAMSAIKRLGPGDMVYDRCLEALEMLEPLDVPGEPNTLVALVQKAMHKLEAAERERDSLREALGNLMDAVAPELTGAPKNVNKSSWAKQWDAANAALKAGKESKK